MTGPEALPRLVLLWLERTWLVPPGAAAAAGKGTGDWHGKHLLQPDSRAGGLLHLVLHMRPLVSYPDLREGGGGGAAQCNRRKHTQPVNMSKRERRKCRCLLHLAFMSTCQALTDYLYSRPVTPN
jgi:hypothetical protein